MTPSKMQKRNQTSTISNTASACGASPTDAHVARIRNCYQKSLAAREEFFSLRFTSPRVSSNRSLRSPKHLFMKTSNGNGTFNRNSRNKSHHRSMGAARKRAATQPNGYFSEHPQHFNTLGTVDIALLNNDSAALTGDKIDPNNTTFMQSKDDDTTLCSQQHKGESSVLASSMGGAANENRRPFNNNSRLRYQERESWRKIQAAYSSSRGGSRIIRSKLAGPSSGLGVTSQQQPMVIS